MAAIHSDEFNRDAVRIALTAVTGKRSQLGAHDTERDKIMQIVDPVIIRPLLDKRQAALDRAAAARNPVRRAYSLQLTQARFRSERVSAKRHVGTHGV